MSSDGSNKFILMARTKSKSCFAIVEHREEEAGWMDDHGAAGEGGPQQPVVAEHRRRCAAPEI